MAELSNYDDKRLGYFELGKTIGEGTFGKVVMGVHLPTMEKVQCSLGSHQNT